MTPERVQDLGAQAENICTALCSRPDFLVEINSELSSLLSEIEKPASSIASCWDSDQRQLLRVWINATGCMVSEIVNGNERLLQEPS